MKFSKSLLRYRPKKTPMEIFVKRVYAVPRLELITLHYMRQWEQYQINSFPLKPSLNRKIRTKPLSTP